MNSNNNEVDQHCKTFGQVEPTPEPAPDNPQEPNGNEEEAGNEDPA